MIVTPATFSARFFIKTVVNSNIDLAANNRFNAGFIGIIIETYRTKHIAMLCQGHCIHLQVINGID